MSLELNNNAVHIKVIQTSEEIKKFFYIVTSVLLNFLLVRMFTQRI